MFMGADTSTMLISAIGLLIFTGLTAYDAQKMKALYASYEGDEEMLKKRRVQVFNRCMRKAGPAEVMRCLNRNEKAGIQYHYADKLIGDYDLDCNRDIEELLMKGGVHSKG